MNKNVLFKVFLVVLMLCAFGIFATSCGNKVQLVDWEDKTETVKYGATYQVESVATDADGNVYTINEVNVSDSNGGLVSVVQGKFAVTDLKGYTLEYSVTISKKDYQKTVTLSVTSPAPMIKVGTDLVLYKGGEYSIPSCTITDYTDGEITDYVVEIYKVTADGDVMVNYDTEKLTFKPTEEGEYYYLYKATNSAGVNGTAKLKVVVKDLTKYLPYIVNNENKEEQSRVYRSDGKGGTRAVTYDSPEIASFSGDYNGGAVRYNAQYAYDGEFRVKNVYPKETLEQIKQDYTHVSLWWAYSLVEEDGEQGEIYLLNNHSNIAEPYDCFFSKAGALGAYYTAGGNVWRKISVEIDDYIKLLEDCGYEYFMLFGSGNRNNEINEEKSSVYIGDIFFDNVVPESFIVNADNYMAYNYNGNSTSSYVNYLAAGSEELETLSGDYTGNAVKMKIAASHNGQYRIKNSYTKAQFDRVKNEYQFVTIYWAFSITPITSSSSCYVNFLPSTSGNSILIKGEVTGSMNNSSGINNVWQKTTISFADYIELLEDTNYQYVVPFRTGDINNIDTANSWFYLGNVIFSKTSDPNEPNEPTPAPTVQDVDQTNGDHIQYWQ